MLTFLGEAAKKSGLSNTGSNAELCPSGIKAALAGNKMLAPGRALEGQVFVYSLYQHNKAFKAEGLPAYLQLRKRGRS